MESSLLISRNGEIKEKMREPSHIKLRAVGSTQAQMYRVAHAYARETTMPSLCLFENFLRFQFTTNIMLSLSQLCSVRNYWFQRYKGTTIFPKRGDFVGKISRQEHNGTRERVVRAPFVR